GYGSGMRRFLRFFGCCLERLVEVGFHVLSHVVNVVLDFIQGRCDVLDLIFPTRFELLCRLFELPDTLSQRFSEFRQLLRSEDQKGNNENQQHLRKTKLTHGTSCNCDNDSISRKQIGRASCREREETRKDVVAGAIT